MKIFQGTVLCALLLLVFIACEHRNEVENLSRRDKKDVREGMLDTTAMPDQVANKNPDLKNNSQQNADYDKRIIKTANLNIEISNYNNFNSELHKNVKQFGGYIAQEEQNQSEYLVSNNVTIKVPVEQFDDAVVKLVAGNKAIIEKKISSDDVTMEIVDVKSRMEAKKQFRQRYLDLLKQAKNMNDILQVQTEINGIQEQIESANGRMTYLNHASVFSTINLRFFQIINPGAKDEDHPSYSNQIKQAFANGGKWAIEIFIGLLNLWPLIVLSIGLLFAFRKWSVRRIKANEIRSRK